MMDNEPQNIYITPPDENVPEAAGGGSTDENTVPADEHRGPTFRGGLIVGLCIGAIACLAVGITAHKRVEAYTSRMGDILDLGTLSKISAIKGVIDEYFYDYNDRSLTTEDMREGLYQGLVDSLGDRHSDYMSAEEFEEDMIDSQGIYYGVGAYISIGDNGYPFFSGIMEDTPAQKAGLRTGDVIVEVDDVSAYEMTLDDVVSRVRGELGTVVHLTIFREGEDDYIGFDVERGEVTSRTVSHRMLEGDIGYIQISQFDLVTVDQFKEAYQDILSQNARGLILDLRGNPGGLVVSVTGIGNQILPKGIIFYEEDASGKRTDYTCDGENEIQIPLVVLVNGYSASASEILSGAIRDHGVGTLVGTKTYGKGVVQDTIRLSDGSAVKLTISAYYLPKGDNIQGTGITPDIETELDVDAYYKDGTDSQLDKAVEVIRDQLK